MPFPSFFRPSDAGANRPGAETARGKRNKQFVHPLACNLRFCKGPMAVSAMEAM